MALTLTDITPPVYKGVQEVARESVGFVKGSMVNGSEESAAHNTPIRSIYAGPATSQDVSGQMNFPTLTGTNATERTLTLSGYKASHIEIRGEQAKLIGQGSGFTRYIQDEMSQAAPPLALDVEEAVKDAIEADAIFGAAIASPFGSNLNAGAEIRERLQLMGASELNRCLIMTYATAANLLQQSDYRADSDRTDEGSLRTGRLGMIFGMQPYESSRQVNLAAGNPGNSAAANNSGGYGVGTEAIAVDGTANNFSLHRAWVVIGNFLYRASTQREATGSNRRALSGSSGFLRIAGGLREAVPDNQAVDAPTAGACSAVYPMNAVEVACRQPAVDGDSAREAMPVTDPVSGLTFRVATYGGYHNMMVELSCVYGAKPWNTEHALLVRG